MKNDVKDPVGNRSDVLKALRLSTTPEQTLTGVMTNGAWMTRTGGPGHDVKTRIDEIKIA